MLAKKYQVGKMSRKDLLNAIEHLLESGEDAIVRLNAHHGKRYEIRAKKRPHGVQLDWGLPGTFFCPNGYDN
jgi:hypothetical protein